MSLQYKGLKANYEKKTVSESEIDRQIARLREQTPSITVVKDRPARLGDEVVLDYAGSCGGVPFEGGTAQGQTLTLGSGAFIPGFEEQLVGKQLEEPVTVRVTFPTEYHSESLAGKAAEFACVIHEIREKSEYGLDDDFAGAMGCESFAALRRRVAESLQEFYDQRGEQELQDQLLRQAAAGLDYSPTEAELDRAVNGQMQTLAAQLALQNLTLEDYCRFTGNSEQQLREDARPEAEQSLRIQAAVEQIAELEGFQAEETEIADACAEVCARNQITMEQLMEYRDEAFDEAILRNVLRGKVLRLICDNAEITTV
ncbi:MAG: trigger factor [Oscillospiraceae bacterium]|nr:trigger factor [Oscillospiraceae bacterium]